MTVYTFPLQALAAPLASSAPGIHRQTGKQHGELLLLPPGVPLPCGDFSLVLSLSKSVTRSQATSGLFLLNTACAEEFPRSQVYITSQISGGTLTEYWQSSLSKWGSRLWLLLFPMCHRFPIPCPDGQCEEISPDDSRQLQNSSHVHFCEEFLCHYCYGADDGGAWMHLFDTSETMQQKLDLAESIDIPHVVCFMQTIARI